MNYTLNLSGTKAYIHDGSILDGMFDLLPNVTEFIFDDGTYSINNKLEINKNNITLRSKYKKPQNVHIHQNSDQYDGLVIKNCRNINIIGLSIHNEHDGKIALTAAGIEMTLVEKCYFYGNHDSFCIYYAGPSDLTEGESTLNAYENRNLDNLNIFRKNVVYTKWSGDSISFSLQKNGEFTNNIIRGGKLAVYMCANCKIICNKIYDSTSNGIYVSLPSHNLCISYNTLYECAASAIKITNQIEHGDYESSNHEIVIDHNNIYDSKFYGIEINFVDNVHVINNKMLSTDIYGLYLYNSSNASICSNIISYFRVGIWLEICDRCKIHTNTFNSVYPDKSDNVIKLISTSDTTITDNLVRGQIEYELYAADDNCTNITETNNTLNQYYSYEDELHIMKMQ